MGFDVLRCSELLPEFVFISNAMPEVTNLTHVPSVDGNAPSFANYKEKNDFSEPDFYSETAETSR